MDGLPLFEQAKFHGEGYDKAKDHARLTGQLKKVHDLLVAAMDIDHVLPRRLSLHDISSRTGAPEASVSACIRTLRNQFGFVIDKERVKEYGGTWVYWIAAGGMGEHSRRPRKMKPIGDKVLFGKMMQAIYAYGKAPGSVPWMTVEQAASTWALDMSEKVRDS